MTDPSGASFPRRFLAANLVLLAAVGLVIGLIGPRGWSRPDVAARPTRASRLTELVTALPETVGQWRGYPGVISQTVADVLRYDWGAARTYVRGDEAISFYAFRSQGEKAFLLRAHTPPVCALAQGWQNVAVEPQEITVAGVPVAAQRMVAEQHGVYRVTFYREFPGQHVDGRGRQVADIFAVQANMFVPSDVEAAAQTLREFLAEIAPGDVEGASHLLTIELASRAFQPGARLEVASLWRLPAPGYVVAQLVGADGATRAEQRVAVAGSSRAQLIRFALAVPEDIPVGRYDLKLTFHGGTDAPAQPFVTPEGNLAAEMLKPLVVKPAQPLGKADLPCAAAAVATFGTEIVLLCHQAPTAIQVGQPFTLTLYWQARQPPEHDYVGFLRLRDMAGNIVLERNAELADGSYPTSTWEAGEIIADVRVLPTQSLPAGAYRFEVGLFSNWDLRGQVVEADGWENDGFRLVLGRLVIKPPQEPPCTMQHRVDADLGGELALLGYDLDWRPGQPLSVTLCWQAQRRIDADYSVFVHLLGPDGQIVTQHDSWPMNNRYPTSAWDAEEIVTDIHVLDAGTLPVGTYRLAVGMYDLRTMRRLLVHRDGAASSDDRLLLSVR